MVQEFYYYEYIVIHIYDLKNNLIHIRASAFRNNKKRLYSESVEKIKIEIEKELFIYIK